MAEKQNQTLSSKYPTLLKQFIEVMASQTKYADVIELAVQACHRGLKQEDKIIKINNWLRIEDLIGHFVTDCCREDPYAVTTAKDLYDSFNLWWQINIDCKVPSQKRFGTILGKIFQRSKSGTYKYAGIGLNITPD